MSLSKLFALTILAITLITVESADSYTTAYDKIDFNAILRNEIIYKRYLNCLLHKGPCTADGEALRDILPDALMTACTKCNPKQKEVTRKVVTYIRKYKPVDWTALTNKYDPEGRYKDVIESFVENN
ncbi:ejaculatory bulb-specific protein 3-like [Fopius arisanus]|uniref:Ejaculatory bulb-specific protein 3-like n=1 Tax=Fopius arisanus TaxID=64838 RepID=A0A0C9R9K1_9HYME|nr:PREDICTED: ejaculatory bulb-specific protein 3-like [Fopius arisanus]